MVTSLVNAEELVTNSLQKGTKAQAVKRMPPRYPGVELSRGRQGWVELSYVVTTDGTVVDPVVQDSSGSPHFERAALQVVEDWKFEPATWNGEVVQQCDNKVLLTFAIEDSGKLVSREFARKHRKITEELEAGDLDKAKKLIDAAFDSKYLTLPEASWLWALEAHRAALVGDKQAQLEALRRATISNGRWTNDDLYSGLLLVETMGELETGNYSAALRTYEKLVETDGDNPRLAKIQPNIDQLRSIVASDKVFAVDGNISGDRNCADCRKTWSYTLLRQSFSIASINGELGDLEIRCARQRVVDKARPDITWEIPESWGSCSVIVFGAPGSSFQLLELPSA